MRSKVRGFYGNSRQLLLLPKISRLILPAKPPSRVQEEDLVIAIAVKTSREFDGTTDDHQLASFFNVPPEYIRHLCNEKYRVFLRCAPHHSNGPAKIAGDDDTSSTSSFKVSLCWAILKASDALLN